MVTRPQGKSAADRLPAVAVEQIGQAGIDSIFGMPGLALFIQRTRAVHSVQRQLRFAQSFKQTRFFRDPVEKQEGRFDGRMAAVDHALEDDLENFAGGDIGRHRGSDGVFERALTLGHRELADQHQKPVRVSSSGQPLIPDIAKASQSLVKC